MVDFWEVHGLLFVICLFFFPRLTLLFATVWGGVLWWIGWLFAPRLTVAILATSLYWETNTVLVVLTWLWALGGEGTEKGTMRRTVRKRRHKDQQAQEQIEA